MKHAIFSAVFLLLFPLTAVAASFQAGDTVEVESSGNAYAAGSVVQVSQDVHGDVYLIGETIHTNGIIHEDALLLGSNITINARIGDDLRAFGSVVLLNNNIDGDVIVFGQRVVVSEHVRIIGQSIIGGQQVILDGRFDGDVRLLAEELSIAGTYLGSVRVNGGPNVTISEKTSIQGDLHLTIPEGAEIIVPKGVVQGEVLRNFVSPEHNVFVPLQKFRIFSLLSRLLIGILLVFFARTFMLRYGAGIHTKHGKISPSEFFRFLGTGLLFVVLMPVIAFLLFFPVITIPIAILLLLTWGSLLYIGSALSGLIVAQVFVPLRQSNTTLQLFGKFALGTFSLFVFRLIPLAGMFIGLMFSLLSYGAIIDSYRRGYTSLRKAKVI